MESVELSGGEVHFERRKAGEARPGAVDSVVSGKSGSRRKVARRRQIDPTTRERDYSSEELEFMRALDAYKRANGRMFPTCSEILEVIRSLGYVREGQDAVVSVTVVASASGEAEVVEAEAAPEAR